MRYRRLYEALLRLYPASFHDRFAEGMAQTFNDMCRERRNADAGLLLFVLATFAETTAGIISERKRTMTTRKKNILRVAVGTAALLLIPLVAMQFNDDVNWTLFDFVVAGGLLFGTGATFVLVAGRADTTVYRVAFGFAIGTSLLLIWVNLAVGVIGSEDNPANVLYLGVIAVVFLGAIIARLRPRGMARALFATALAQALVPVLALLIWQPPAGSAAAYVDIARVIALNAFFVVLFVGSGLLFRWAGDADRAGERRPG
jgi:hypothetical protein